jgi:hypothetical protein
VVGVFFSSPAETQPDYSGPRSFPIHGCGGGDFHVQHSVWSLFKSWLYHERGVILRVLKRTIIRAVFRASKFRRAA